MEKMNQVKDIADKAAKIDLLEKEIEGRKEGYWALKEKYDKLEEELDDKNEEIETLKNSFNALKEEMVTRYITIETNNSICETYDNKVAELEKELADCKVKIRHQKENLDGINKTLEIRTKENESLIAVRNNLNKEIEAHESENARLSEKIIELKKERDKHMSRVNDLRMELDCMKARKEKHEEAAHDKVVEGLRETITYWRNKYVAAQEEIEKLDGTIEEWKNKERIRTNELRATERKVEELLEEIERLRDLGEHWKRSYFNIRYSLNKLKDESKEDDYGKSGFKRYIEHLIEEEERAVPERFKARLNEEITEIFTKEEETEVKGVGRTNSGRYPWGAKVNDIPCGEDAIE